MEKLFALPGRLLQSRYVHDDYSANLIVRASDAESFDMLGDNGAEPDLALEQVSIRNAVDLKMIYRVVFSLVPP